MVRRGGNNPLTQGGKGFGQGRGASRSEQVAHHSLHGSQSTAARKPLFGAPEFPQAFQFGGISQRSSRRVAFDPVHHARGPPRIAIGLAQRAELALAFRDEERPAVVVG